jgi:6-phosphofructokinase 1
VFCVRVCHPCRRKPAPKKSKKSSFFLHQKPSQNTLSFDTAVEEAQRSLLAAKVEASSTSRGVGLVRLMGRQSGYIAMNASMASGVVDLCLIPEVPFTLPALVAAIERILERKGHAVVCVAEGAGQDIIEAAAAAAGNGGGGGHSPSSSGATDASGNPILADVGTFLKSVIKARVPGADVKYIDPSYMIRAVPTNSSDRIYCKVLGQGAVHGAFAGYTDFTVGLVNTHYVYLPIPVITQAARTVDPKGRAWNRLKVAIRQPDLV